MPYKITLSTRDNQDFSFDCEPNQTVQEAAEAAHLFPPFGCKSGACGTCLGTCDKGEYQLGEYNETTLSKDAFNSGDILLCRTTAQSDLHINVPYNADSIQQTLMPPREAEIISLDNIAE
ncbi:MAG: 2Fe-2S iron-sulfur cluster binding domain-containing protein, partial [Methyloprofundus sp.]|nr:2Fe-2S iron-sulfur cluster binding domain-containing protein [Methyloprofundus sp.]